MQCNDSLFQLNSVLVVVNPGLSKLTGERERVFVYMCIVYGMREYLIYHMVTVEKSEHFRDILMSQKVTKFSKIGF